MKVSSLTFYLDNNLNLCDVTFRYCALLVRGRSNSCLQCRSDGQAINCDDMVFVSQFCDPPLWLISFFAFQYYNRKPLKRSYTCIILMKETYLWQRLVTTIKIVYSHGRHCTLVKCPYSA